MTETGYRYHFGSPADMDAEGGPIAFVRAWRGEARSPDWRGRKRSAASSLCSEFSRAPQPVTGSAPVGCAAQHTAEALQQQRCSHRKPMQGTFAGTGNLNTECQRNFKEVKVLPQTTVTFDSPVAAKFALDPFQPFTGRDGALLKK